MASGPLADASIPTVKSESSQHRRRTRIVRGKLCRASTAICWPAVTLLTPTQGNIPLRNRVRSLRQTLYRAEVVYGLTQPDHPRADCYPAEIVGIGLAGTT